MSKLYGKTTGDRGSSTRASQREITGWVQTEQGRITVELDDTGRYVVLLHQVYQRDTSGAGLVLSSGNVNTQTID